MQYLYHQDAGAKHLTLTGDEHRYIFKVRRHRAGETIMLRNLNDQNIYSYNIESMDKKEASLLLSSQRELRVEAKQPLHIGWCMIEPKNIEKLLPTLNEIGVDKITFIECQRSQKNFKLDLKRLEKILPTVWTQCHDATLAEPKYRKLYHSIPTSSYAQLLTQYTLGDFHYRDATRRM